jgi:hypothetical protein
MSTIPPTTGNGLWRLLICDRDPTDPKWIVATVIELADVRPATDSMLAIPDVDEVTARWVAGRVRAPIAFTRLVHPEVWRIDEGGQR